MMEGHRPTDDEATPAGSVFGNLPSERPGTRSPRRSAVAETPADAGEPNAEPTRPAAAPREPEHLEQAQGRGGIEDLAWAGVAAAAEAATLGVRLASRAIERLRDGVDRR